MVVIMEYTVLRQHYGDKQYYAGDRRKVDNNHDAKALIDMGLIAPTTQKAKASPKNKAEPALENKGNDSDDTEDNT